MNNKLLLKCEINLKTAAKSKQLPSSYYAIFIFVTIRNKNG